MSVKSLRVLLVDDHVLVRAGIRHVIELYSDIRVVGEADSIDGAVDAAIILNPDVILMDVRLKDGSGVDASRKILATQPRANILFLTFLEYEDTVPIAISIGARGVISKTIHPSELIRAIQAVALGHSLFHSHCDPELRPSEIGSVSLSRRTYHITPQESRVLALLANGKTNKEIALLLNLSDKTIKNYVSSLFCKLHVTRRTQAAAFYFAQPRHRE